MISGDGGVEDRCAICLEERAVNVFTCRDAPGACINRICPGCIERWIHSGAVCTICRNSPVHPQENDDEVRMNIIALIEIMNRVDRMAERRQEIAITCTVDHKRMADFWKQARSHVLIGTMIFCAIALAAAFVTLIVMY